MSILNATPLIVNPAIEGTMGDMAGISACYFDAPIADLTSDIMKASTLRVGDMVNLTHKKVPTDPGETYIQTLGVVESDWSISSISSGTHPIAWGDITGTINNQTDLEAALVGAASSATWGDITGNMTHQTDLQTEFTKFTALVMNFGTFGGPSGTVQIRAIHGRTLTGIKTGNTVAMTFVPALPSGTLYTVNVSPSTNTAVAAAAMQTVTVVPCVTALTGFSLVVQDSGATPTTSTIIVNISIITTK